MDIVIVPDAIARACGPKPPPSPSEAVKVTASKQGDVSDGTVTFIDIDRVTWSHGHIVMEMHSKFDT